MATATPGLRAVLAVLAVLAVPVVLVVPAVLAVLAARRVGPAAVQPAGVTRDRMGARAAARVRAPPAERLAPMREAAPAPAVRELVVPTAIASAETLPHRA
jgi:hypothetical protein